MEFNKKQRIFLSISTGILLFGGWTQTSWQVLILFGFVPLLLVEHFFCINKDHYKSYHFFLHSYLSFFVWNALSTWWIMKATIVGAILAIAFNAFFMAVVAYVFHIVKRNTSTKIGYIFFVLGWLTFEYIHYNWELSWTWMTLGNGLSEQIPFIQWFEFTGVLGGSLLILLTNVILTVIFIQWIIDAYVKRIIIVLLALIVIIPTSISILMFYNYNDKGRPIDVLIVQPNIDPYNEKFEKLTEEQQLNKFLKLASSNIKPETKYIIGPETALPQGIWEEDFDIHPHINILKDFARKYQVSFIVGASTFKMFNYKISSVARKYDNNKYYEAYNTALQIDSNNVQVYHKSKLVLGVEKMPFPKILFFLEDLALELGGTSGSLGTQEKPSIFYGKSKVVPAICYESVYGEFLSIAINKGAEWIAVITNDGWWGDTPGYKQHLSYSRLRAIEFRKSIARCANTGISAIINQKGEIVESTNWWKPETIGNKIYANEIKTFYAQWGDYIGRLASLLTLLMIISLIVRKIIQKK